MGAHLLRRRRDPRGDLALMAGRLEPVVEPPRESKFWPPLLAPCSRHKCTDCGDLRAARCTYPLSCSLMAARAPRSGEGVSGEVSFPEPPGSPKVELPPPPPRLKALRRSRRGLPWTRPRQPCPQPFLTPAPLGAGCHSSFLAPLTVSSCTPPLCGGSARPTAPLAPHTAPPARIAPV